MLAELESILFFERGLLDKESDGSLTESLSDYNYIGVFNVSYLVYFIEFWEVNYPGCLDDFKPLLEESYWIVFFLPFGVPAWSLSIALKAIKSSLPPLFSTFNGLFTLVDLLVSIFYDNCLSFDAVKNNKDG